MPDKVHVCDLAPAEMAEHEMLQTIITNKHDYYWCTVGEQMYILPSQVQLSKLSAPGTLFQCCK